MTIQATRRNGQVVIEVLTPAHLIPELWEYWDGYKWSCVRDATLHQIERAYRSGGAMNFRPHNGHAALRTPEHFGLHWGERV